MVIAKSTKALSPMEILLAKAEKKYDLNVAPIASMTSNAKFISTGNMAIDAAMGGGFPLGRMGEFYGPNASGKTTLAMHIAINLQRIIKLGGSPELGIRSDDVVLYSDYEQAMDLEYAVSLGLDPEHPSFLFTQPDTLEQGADFMLAAFKTGQLKFGVVDSVAAMVPSLQAEQESVGKALPAITARLMKTFGQNLNPVLREAQGSLVFINHEMQVMSMGGPASYGPPPTTTPGGVALKFFAGIRLQFKQIKQHKGPIINPVTGEVEEVTVMTDVRVKVMKNKVAPPFRQATVRVRFGRGFDNFHTAMLALIAAKKVTHTNSRFYFEKIIGEVPADWMPREPKTTKRPYIYGEKALFKAADAHPEWRDQLITMAEGIVKENIKIAKALTPQDAEQEESEEEEEADLDALIAADTSGKRREI